MKPEKVMDEVVDRLESLNNSLVLLDVIRDIIFDAVSSEDGSIEIDDIRDIDTYIEHYQETGELHADVLSMLEEDDEDEDGDEPQDE